MIARIQLRRGSAAEWLAANPVLAAGELGVETGTWRLKLGDGETAWEDLGYLQGGDDGPAGDGTMTLTVRETEPTLPSAGATKLYAKADGLYVIDSAGNITKVATLG